MQSSMFHERKQKPDESVDAYAQDCRRLFHLAYGYTKAQQGSQETEVMGRSVLAYQFVAGLLHQTETRWDRGFNGREVSGGEVAGFGA